MIATIFSIGAFIIACLAYHEVTKDKKPKKNKSSDFTIIRPEFRKEAESERKHRMKQRKKYGIFDENGKRIDKK